MPRQIIRTFGLDKDTVAFAQRVRVGSGTTILPNNLIQLNKFVVGIKRMGLWNQMVCWPMRSTQNSGRGSTVYSLGGLGTFNGTLVNSPTWGNNGVNCSIANQTISFGPSNNIQSYGGFTNFGVQQYRGLLASQQLAFSTRQDAFWPASTSVFGTSALMQHRVSTSVTRYVAAQRTGFDFSQWHSYTATLDVNESGFLTYNKTTPIAFGAPVDLGQAPIGNWVLNLNDVKGVYAIHGVFRTYIQGQREQFYDLYRQTLGQNLGLPV